MTFRHAFLTLFAACAAAITQPAFAQEVLPQTVPVALDTQDPGRSELGGLTYLGGLEITSEEAKLGGISSLEWHEGRLFAVMDDGRWLILTPDEIGEQLVDVIALEQGPLNDLRGKRLRGKSDSDAEAITRTPDGTWLVAFEREHRIWRYQTLDGEAAETDLAIVDLAFDAAENAGLEALTHSSEGLLACGEWVGKDTLNCMRERGAGLVAFEVRPPDELAGRGAVPTDASCSSDGTCYVLLRSYSPDLGNAAAIMTVSPANEVSTLATFLPPITLDNFEGLAVRELNGRTYLYAASDDNFSDKQRTLLMKFEVPGARQEVELPPPPSTEIDTTIYETVSVVLETSLGDITIALEVERAPITAANFLRYVDDGRFDGTKFYRAMSLDREPRPNGLIQGGTQWDPKRILDGIPHEPTTETGLSHTSGALSMAMGEPGTANGDFSIMLQDQIGLDARPDSDNPIWQNGYAVFGYVTDGMDVVAKIHAQPTDPNKGEGAIKGQLLIEPVTIIKARRAEPRVE